MSVRSLFSVLTIAAAGCAAIVGCASSRNGPFLGEKFDDPPQLSPYNQPLNSGQQQITPYRGLVPGPYQSPGPLSNGNGGFFAPGRSVPMREPTPSTGGNPEQSGPSDSPGPAQLGSPRTYEETVPTYPDADQQPADSGPEETIRQRQETDPLTAPSPKAAPDDAPAESTRSTLELQVNDPQRVQQAEAARFEVVIRNPTDKPVDNVVIECRFEEGLSFPQLTDRALRQRLGTLGASESRTIDLALTAEEVGLRCVDFTLSADEHDPVEIRRCVEVFDPDSIVEPSVNAVQAEGGLQIRLVGPPARNAGGRLECVLSLENHTGDSVSGVLASINHDAALVPREVSTGARRSPGTLTWDLGLLGADERVQIQVEFACPNPAEHVCIDAQVSARDLPVQQQEVCAVIHPRPTLDVAVADSRDPVPVGETTTYLVSVTNRGLDVIGDVRIDVTLDGGLEIVSGSQNVSEVSTQSAGPKARTFTIAGPIAPDDHRTLQIDTRGTAVGVGGLRVLATELDTNRRINVEEPTVINPPLLGFPGIGDFADSE